jgi:hypothetical protein
MSQTKRKKEPLVANANITKLGVTDAVALEEAAKAAAPQEAVPVTEASAPNVSERRVVGKKEFKTPSGQVIVIENL